MKFPVNTSVLTGNLKGAGQGSISYGSTARRARPLCKGCSGIYRPAERTRDPITAAASASRAAVAVFIRMADGAWAAVLNCKARQRMHTARTTVASDAIPAAIPRPSERAAPPATEEISHARQMRKSVMISVRTVRRHESRVRSGCRPGSLVAGPATGQRARRMSTEKAAAAKATTIVIPISSQEWGSSRL